MTPADIDAVARVHVACWHETYRGLLPDRLLANLSIEEHAGRRWRAVADPAHLALVAEDTGGAIVGFCEAGPPRDYGTATADAEVYTLYLLRRAQGLGTGRALFERMRAALAALGRRSLLLWVLEGNDRACRFYERAGGVAVERSAFELDGTPLFDIAYRFELALVAEGGKP
jgi:ribosomal protein S18 acetylase RimI-like enzyme